MSGWPWLRTDGATHLLEGAVIDNRRLDALLVGVPYERPCPQCDAKATYRGAGLIAGHRYVCPAGHGHVLEAR